ncbi:MAG: carboxypeptidase-like regulatory domain-containing protein, partial [Gemmataceae bacterium]|nr:carboxypeptidase-like regulatory domain-containing protein [Gemmataceae bacterium]
YRYSCYFDPCTCSYQKVACPVTAYQLRAQCCPVQSWVQRCCSVPVTTYQRCSYWEPQTCCTDPCSNGCAVPNGGAAVVPPPPVGVQPSTPPPPIIDENLRKSGNGAPPTQQFYGPGNAAPGSRQPLPNGVAPFKPASPAPAARPERIAALDARVQGQVVNTTNSPLAGARVLFISANREAPNQTVTAGSGGRFQVNLPAGGWLVYVTGADGRHTFHSRIDVDGRQPVGTLTVLSR